MLQPNIWMQIPFRFKIGICKWYLGPMGEVGYLSMLGFSVTFDLIHSVTEQSEGPMGSRIYLYVIAYTKFYQNASICSEGNGSFRPLSRSPWVVSPWVVSPPSRFALHYVSRFALLPWVVSPTTWWVVSPTF